MLGSSQAAAGVSQLSDTRRLRPFRAKRTEARKDAMTLRSPVRLPRADEILPSRSTVAAHQVDQAHETISQLFCEHRLSPLERREVDMRLRSAHDTGIGVELLDYGEAVRIAVPQGLEEFHLVQLPLAGRATMEAGNALVQSSPEVATLPPLDRAFTMRWGASTPTLIVYVRRDRLTEAAQGIYGIENAERLRLGLHMQMTTPAGADFLRALLEHHDALEAGTPEGAYTRRLTGELLVARLLQAVPNSAGDALSAWQPAEPSAGARADGLVRRFEAAVDAGVESGSGVLDIAKQLGVPLRTLQEHVRRATGSTPLAMLKEARLRRARELLVGGDPTRVTVTAVAERCGFGHLGRFASEYRARFGETPASTLRR